MYSIHNRRFRRIIRGWFGSFTSSEIACDEGTTQNMVLKIWYRGRKLGLIPNRRRPVGGF